MEQQSKLSFKQKLLIVILSMQTVGTILFSLHYYHLSTTSPKTHLEREFLLGQHAEHKRLSAELAIPEHLQLPPLTKGEFTHPSISDDFFKLIFLYPSVAILGTSWILLVVTCFTKPITQEGITQAANKR